MTEASTAASRDWDFPSDGSAHDDALLGCLLMLGRIKQRHCTEDSLTAGLPLVDDRLTPGLFIRAARRIGLSASIKRRPLEDISNLVLPAVLLLNDGRACILERTGADGVARILLPESGNGAKELPLGALAEIYSGYAIFVQEQYRYDERTSDTALSRPQHWFRDTLAQAWPLYGEVALAALLINLFALASPLFIMNVYDRVVPNHAIETLWVLGAGIAIVYLFDLLMRTLRSYFLDVAGKRADIVLSANVFERVLGARMSARPQSVGAYANNLNEFDAFREFFTSLTLTTLIDLPFVFLFIFTIWLIGGHWHWYPCWYFRCRCVLPC